MEAGPLIKIDYLDLKLVEQKFLLSIRICDIDNYYNLKENIQYILDDLINNSLFGCLTCIDYDKEFARVVLVLDFVTENDAVESFKRIKKVTKFINKDKEVTNGNENRA